MNRTEHLLIVLIEECSEVIKEASKSIRFGLDDFDPNGTESNRTKLITELNDLFAVAEMLKSDGVISNFNNAALIKLKKDKVEKYLNYSNSKNK